MAPGNRASRTAGGSYWVRGCEVQFPFEPYAAQLSFMEEMIKALQDGSNALLESPTGTGKTLCLLTAALSWRQTHAACVQAHRGGVATTPEAIEIQQRLAAGAGQSSTRVGEGGSGSKSFGTPAGEQPAEGMCQRIVYMSRTHGQLAQVMRELKGTMYTPKVSIMGSRQQLCIHKDVSKLKGGAQNAACQKLVSGNQCALHARVQNHKLEHPQVFNTLDIEDLCKHGEAHRVCPYYLSRNMAEDAEIVFMPYNYLTDPASRRSLSSLWPDSIIIFDEAHNLGNICAEAASFDLGSEVISSAEREVSKCISQLETGKDLGSASEVCSQDELSILKAILLEFEKVLDGLELRGNPPEMTREGSFILQVFEWAGVKYDNSPELLECLERAVNMIQASAGPAPSSTPALKLFSDAVQTVFKQRQGVSGDTAGLYRVHVGEAKPSRKAAQEARTNLMAPAVHHISKYRTLGYWCFSAGVTMKEIQSSGVRSIILASGTLSPMESWEAEMQIPFQVVLENQHVIENDQVLAMTLCKGPSGVELNSSYKQRDRPEYRSELGNVICNVSRVVPGGVLVFFPSYSALADCEVSWREKGIWERLDRIKTVFVEPRDSASFRDAVQAYCNHVDQNPTSGAVLMAVCRGKMSEGIDFADRHGRAVIVTGIPFPSYMDPKVKLKRQWLDSAAAKQGPGGGLSGDKWYNQQASRAVNQAVGRVIRHKGDFGAVILCDQRFANWGRQNLISKWIKPRLTTAESYGDLCVSLSHFFKQHKPPPTLPEAVVTAPTEGQLEGGGRRRGERHEGRESGEAAKVRRGEGGRRVAVGLDSEIEDTYQRVEGAGKVRDGFGNKGAGGGGLLEQLEGGGGKALGTEGPGRGRGGGKAAMGLSEMLMTKHSVGLQGSQAKGGGEKGGLGKGIAASSSRERSEGAGRGELFDGRPVGGVRSAASVSVTQLITASAPATTAFGMAPSRPPAAAKPRVSAVAAGGFAGDGVGGNMSIGVEGLLEGIGPRSDAKGGGAPGLEGFLKRAKQELSKGEYGEFKGCVRALKAKGQDREATMRLLYRLLGGGSRGALLTTLCGFLGKAIVRELRVFLQREHPESLGLVPEPS